jgi:hypothetical protein
MSQVSSLVCRDHSPLSNTPVEVFLLISEQLSAVALTALSLTCRPFYFILKAKVQLYGVDRDALLLLLEKDLGDKLYYCPYCSRLHRFSPSSSPVDLPLKDLKTESCCYERSPVSNQGFTLLNLGYYNLYV